MNQLHFRTLDAIRGLAAVAVVCFHAKTLIAPINLAHGYLAVDLFFVLSGFVIANAYSQRLSTSMGVWRFAITRTIRLYPLYLLGTVMGIALYGVASHFGAKDGTPPFTAMAAIASAFFMLPNIFIIEPRHWVIPFNVAGWSLILELGVNILFAAISPWLTNKRLWLIIGTSGVLVVGLVLSAGNADLGANLETFAQGAARACFSFFLGIALWRAPRRAIVRTPWAWLLLALVALIFFVPMKAGPYFDLMCILVIFPAIVYWGAQYEAPNDKSLLFLGQISFALYAIHAPAITAVKLALHKLGIAEAHFAPGIGLSFVACAIVAAWLAHRYFDTPVRAAINARLMGRRARKSAKASAH